MSMVPLVNPQPNLDLNQPRGPVETPLSSLLLRQYINISQSNPFPSLFILVLFYLFFLLFRCPAKINAARLHGENFSYIYLLDFLFLYFCIVLHLLLGIWRKFILNFFVNFLSSLNEMCNNKNSCYVEFAELFWVFKIN